MNLLLLKPDEIRPDGTALLTGRRHLHAKEILRASEGDEIRVGILHGQRGKARILPSLDQALHLSVECHLPPPPRPGWDVVLAIPRPKALKKVLPACASLGIDRIFLVNAARVEKSYFDSKVLDPNFIEDLLIQGAEQGQDTVLPRVFVQPRLRPFLEDEVPSLFPTQVQKLLPHPTAPHALSNARAHLDRRVLAIGPEGGWVPFEVALFEAQGFLPVSLGLRTLRVEVALPYLFGALHT